MDWLLFPGSVLTLRSLSGLPEWDSVLGSQEAITLIRHATIIIPTGTIGDRTTLIPSHIHITVATDTPRTTGVELTTAIIAIVITTAIELKSISHL